MGKSWLPPLALCALALQGCTNAGPNDSAPPPPPSLASAPAPGTQIIGNGGECLDVAGGGMADGTPLILFHCHGSPNQNWVVGNNQIVGNGGSCLDVQADAQANGS